MPGKNTSIYCSTTVTYYNRTFSFFEIIRGPGRNSVNDDCDKAHDSYVYEIMKSVLFTTSTYKYNYIIIINHSLAVLS